MTRVNSNYQRLFALHLTVATNLGHAHTPEMCNTTFGNSSNSPGKFNSSSGDGSKALWGSCQQVEFKLCGTPGNTLSRLVQAGATAAALSSSFLPVPVTTKPGAVCAPLQTSLNWCLLVCPSRALKQTEFHRDRALPHSVPYALNCINLLNT